MNICMLVFLAMLGTADERVKMKMLSREHKDSLGMAKTPKWNISQWNLSPLQKILQGFQKAANGNRTHDRRTTNATHYRLCYSSQLSAIQVAATENYAII